MTWVVFTVRVLLGLSFTFTGASFFLMPPMEPPTQENALKFITALGASDYMKVVKVLELLGGLLLLTGRLAPLGLVILVPITVNIALWDIFLMKFAAPPAGLILLALEVLVMWGYWPYFAPFFRADATLAGIATSTSRN